MKIPKLPFSMWFLIAFCPIPGLWLLTLPLWGLHAINSDARHIQIAFGIFMLIWLPAQVAWATYSHIKFQNTIYAIKQARARAAVFIGADVGNKPDKSVIVHYKDGKIVMEESREAFGLPPSK